MYSRDKADNTSKSGSSRVGLYKEFNFRNIYTLEANYNAGKMINQIPPSGLEETKYADPASYNGAPTYDLEIFHDCGKAIGVSILDLAEKNANSRLPNCPLKNLNGVREEAKFDLARRPPFRYDMKLKEFQSRKGKPPSYPIVTEYTRPLRPTNGATARRS